MTVHIGIDSGTHGGVAFIGPGDTASVHDMPVQAERVGDRLLNRLDALALARMLRAHVPADEVAFVTLEKVQAIANMGHGRGQSMSTQGAMMETYGGIRAAVAIVRFPCLVITPQQWKKFYALSKDKNASREMAARLYPEVQPDIKRVKDDGRAESLLIAHYGKAQHDR